MNCLQAQCKCKYIHTRIHMHVRVRTWSQMRGSALYFNSTGMHLWLPCRQASCRGVEFSSCSYMYMYAGMAIIVIVTVAMQHSSNVNCRQQLIVNDTEYMFLNER